jgi:hypothetical protein
MVNFPKAYVTFAYFDSPVYGTLLFTILIMNSKLWRLYHWFDTSAGGTISPARIIRTVASAGHGNY